MMTIMDDSRSFRALATLAIAAVLLGGCIRSFEIFPSMYTPLPAPTRTVLCRDSLNRPAIFRYECPEGYKFVENKP